MNVTYVSSVGKDRAAVEARSRCGFSIMIPIRYGSLKVSSINAFLGCWTTEDFEHQHISGKKTASPCLPSWTGPAVALQVVGRKPRTCGPP